LSKRNKTLKKKH